MTKIRVVIFGCGPIGCSVARYAAQRADIELVGAIDIDESLAGRDLGEVAGVDGKLGVTVSSDADSVLSETRPDVVFLTTSSSMVLVYPQIEKCARAGANVISTCEELSFPHRKSPQLAAEIDRVAKAHSVTVLATGVNPGFLMDAWPLFMTGVCQQVERIRAIRVQDASPRRGPFQKKIGAGRTLEEFETLVASGTLKHVGLPESIAMIADGLGWTLDDITESIEPVIATRQVKTDFVTVEPGQAAGVRQVGRGIRAGEELITLEFEAAVGGSESYDAVYITGIPNMEVVIRGGTHGDIATAAITVNCIHRVVEARPGLLTMRELPVVSAFGKDV
ncbi:MAG: dihydrodipicolinate reductase [Dehalococcoidales bacterium]|nr:dihydrodipicolinate reductase [Dehalococcoidales bacterium]